MDIHDFLIRKFFGKMNDFDFGSRGCSCGFSSTKLMKKMKSHLIE